MEEEKGKKLSELRVIELKVQLEKRGQEAIGLKKELMEKLYDILIEEGQDPEKYLFTEQVKHDGKTDMSEEEEVTEIEKQLKNNEFQDTSDIPDKKKKKCKREKRKKITMK